MQFLNGHEIDSMFHLLVQHCKQRTIWEVSLQSIHSLREIWAFSVIASQHSHREAASCYHKLTPCIVSERTGTQRRTKVHYVCSYCMCCDWQKGMSWDKATSNSEEIKPVALSLVKLCLAGGIRQSVSSQLNTKIIETCWKGLWSV